MWKNKGQVESPSWLIGPLLIVGLISLGAFVALQTYSEISLRIESGSAELQTINMENRLISSQGCLSTGEIGVLNRSKLKEFEQAGDILQKCPPVPSISYKVKVIDLTSDESWTFGDWEVPRPPDSKRPVAIASGSEVHPGRAVLYFSTAGEDLLLALRKNIASAWVTGKSKTLVNLDNLREIVFLDGKIRDPGSGRELLLKIPGKEGLMKVSNPSLTLSKGQTKISFKRKNRKIEISTG